MKAGWDMCEFKQTLVRLCAPTLAGIKPASLFTIPYRSIDACPIDVARRMADRAISCVSRDLRGSGIEIRSLAEQRFGTLVLVYRPSKLAEILTRPEVALMLAAYGYGRMGTEEALAHLGRRVVQANERHASSERRYAFPHEIGVFLGYPLDDVVGFIENEGCNYICLGCWKVYSQPERAVQLFCAFDRCTRELLARFESGESLEELVA